MRQLLRPDKKFVCVLKICAKRSERDLPSTGNCNKIYYFIELLYHVSDLNVINGDKNKTAYLVN